MFLISGFFPELGQRSPLVGYWIENYFLTHLKAKKADRTND